MKILAGTSAISRLDWDKNLFPNLLHGCRWDLAPCRMLGREVPFGCWPEATPRFLSHRHLYYLADNMATGFTSVSKWKRKQESASKMEGTVFWNPILEMTSHHSCYILFIRSKSLGPTPAQEKGGDHTKAWAPGSRDLGALAGGCVLQVGLKLLLWWSCYREACRALHMRISSSVRHSEQWTSMEQHPLVLKHSATDRASIYCCV